MVIAKSHTLIFEEIHPMPKFHVKTVSIAVGHQHAQLSKGQKVFNNLIKQIEKKRARLAAWEIAVPPYQRKYVSEWVPLSDVCTDLQIKMVHCLDGASLRKGYPKPIAVQLPT